MGRPRKGCPPPITPLQVTMHIQRRDYDTIVYKRDQPNQPFHEILHKILAKLDSLEEEVKAMRLELNEYRQFIRAKGLEGELSTCIKKNEAPTQEPSVSAEKDTWAIPNKYPYWDI